MKTIKTSRVLSPFVVFVVLLVASVSFGAKNHLKIERSPDSVQPELDKESRVIQSQELEVILKLLELPSNERSDVINEFIKSGKLKIKETSQNWNELKIVYRTLSDFHRLRVTRDRLSLNVSTAQELEHYIKTKEIKPEIASALLSLTLENKVKGSSYSQTYLVLDFFRIQGVESAVEKNLKNNEFTSSIGIRPENEEILSLEKQRRHGTLTWTLDKATAFNVLQTFRADTKWTRDQQLKRIFKSVKKWDPNFKVVDRSQYSELSPNGYISANYLQKRVLGESLN